MKLDSSLSAIVETCVFCPKLCRYACPVAEAETRETVTPWGLMTLLDDVRRGLAVLDEATAETWAHCTGCRRCQQVCKHDNDVPRALAHARDRARAMGVGPDGWRRWLDAPAPALDALSALPAGGETIVLAGRAEAKRVDAALALLRAAGYSALARPFGGARDAGGRHLSLGDEEGFRSAAQRLLAGLDGASLVICLDAEDAEVLRFEWRARDLWTGPRPRVVHLLEALDGRLDGAPLERVVSGDVLYLDACRLGRGLTLYDAPRALLSRVITGQILEALRSRERGGCCGLGDGLAAVDPDAAADVAQEAAAAPPGAPSAVPVVIAGACADHLRAALSPRPVYALAELLAAGLPQNPTDTSEAS